MHDSLIFGTNIFERERGEENEKNTHETAVVLLREKIRTFVN
jgi:hypothetical protein